jgi:hypothetical protein
MTVAQEGSRLMTLFTKSCPKAPRFNRAIAKWAARDLIESYGLDDCEVAVAWYARVTKSPDWDSFVRSAGDCIRESKNAEHDLSNRKKNLKLANEWRTK